mmetsp:Transcript_17327/g.19995  ORF Transcript_17327/g.19995 Transcript_17327/m.19995 type:complete len:195 (-) Transcript_17327:404-988(-)|eukprot:CAMPEP_0194145148 /NCGR_PEP_ID=MMETSP0152-20130528/15475_1 /TAXON_ID=1049557 /ORGANISM="Thalassiothrix antarctica, Strain L6-D1" /LENGTH=194 /DNA_ID=CAMNT_0038845257 /DNA_START=46 /DNA_END=633 /DNA_ORIENTATION=+
MIVIEREALLSVLRKPPLHSNCDDELEYVLVSHPKTNHGPLVQLLRPSTSYDDECCSLASTLCSSSSTTYTSEDERETRRVTFSDKDEVHVVRRLYPRESLNEHFYSYEDTQRFRQEYRLERKQLVEQDVDESNHEELQDLLPTNDLRKHHISHVVVLHNDKLETFCDPKQQSPKQVDDFFDNDSFWSGSITWY